MPNIKDLEAGGVADALVAEKVMGWSVYGSVGDGSVELYNKWLARFRKKESQFLYLDKAGRLWRYAEKLTEAPEDGEPESEIWSPSTDIKAAFEVVAKIGRGLALHWDPAEKTLDAFRDDKDLSDGARDAYSGCGSWVAGIAGQALTRAATAPLAICRAALRAMDHQSEKR